MDEISKVLVAVRLRPMNKRETDLCTKCVVDMVKNQTILYHPDAPFGEAPKKGSHVKHQPKTFAFDHCFWSMDEKNKSKFHGQDMVFNNVGQGLLNNAFCGYNACIFAYGQTGSGKSYTMMGTIDQRGIIPQLCDALFERINKESNSEEQTHKVEVSYMEIYNEKVHDLLDPASKGNLKVREHKILGPYVDGLSLLAVNCYDDIENLMVEGNKSRTVAATNMNSESSRSHAVFTIKLTQTLHDKASGVSGERVSKMSLVDLAGSERVTKTGAMGDRLKEGSNINKSLTTLGLVIKALAESSQHTSGAKAKKNNFVPYRDSVLTWLLKDNLGGNSKTVMIATVSPAADNYEETLSTLRYADSAKRIVNRAVVNEDPNAKIIRELRTEVETLKQQLVEAESMKAPDLKEKLHESEKLIEEMSKTWEEKLQETERIHKERHQALESMGVSVETSGIKVESDRCYLVNLNADPSLNELLVYYLKDVTKVGSGDNSSHSQDIQLRGLGILPDHCTIEIENNKEVYIIPVGGARTCINGSLIDTRTRAKHGDRILWGNNHFFRLNIPRRDVMSASSELAEELHVDYDFAQQEIIQQAHDPIQESIEAIERQYEDDKQASLASKAALEAQRQMYEQQMLMLRSQITPSGPTYSPYLTGSQSGAGNVSDRLQRRIQQMAQDRNSKFKHGISKLKEELVRVNMYVREANELTRELQTDTQYSITLQIPASNLSANRRRDALMSEPAILARNGENITQIFSMQEFESRLVVMRELYQEHKDKGPLMSISEVSENPFVIQAESHDLIGVANVFLDALFYDVSLDYNVAIINQQGEVAGRLHIELCKLDGSLNDSYNEDVSSIDSEEENAGSSREIVLKVCIKEAKGLPRSLSNFVFCQYTFWGQDEMILVAPKVDETVSEGPSEGPACFKFDHERKFTVPVSEEFTEHLYDGALTIEVYGHSSDEGRTIIGRSLSDRWSEVTRKLELNVEIQELSDKGEFEGVEVQAKPDVYCGGVFQLRQGYSRRLVVRARPVSTTGSLPLTVDSIIGVSIGSLCVRSQAHKGLDSYQEDGLALLRSRWNEALEKRKQYLDEKMQILAAKEEKTESDTERENNLMNQWLSLAEERNDVLVPQAGSGVPGAPATGEPELGIEHHSPVIYLDLNIEDMVPRHNEEEDGSVAESAFLDKEVTTDFLPLPVVSTDNNVSSMTCSWDSSIHNSIHLNRPTPPGEKLYLIVKVLLCLSHPAPVSVTLRKRICINVYKNKSLTMKLRKKLTQTASTMGAGHNTVGRLLHVHENLTSCGILYDIVSNIPKASEELEDRETMAKLAAAAGYEAQESTEDDESYIEKYIKSVAAVESIITLDRLGQEVAIKDSLLASGRSPKRTFSSPNISAIMKNSTSTPTFTDKVKSPLVRLSESFQDLSRHVMKTSGYTTSPLSQGSAVTSTNSVEDHPGSGAKLGSSKAADRSCTADEGYGSTPRRSLGGGGGRGGATDYTHHQLDSKFSEDSRKTLDFANLKTSEESHAIASGLKQPAEPTTAGDDSLVTSSSAQSETNHTFQSSLVTSHSSDQSDCEVTRGDNIESVQSFHDNSVVSDCGDNPADEDLVETATSTPTNHKWGHSRSANQFSEAEAPLALMDSDCETASNTPKRGFKSSGVAQSNDGDNELLIVEEGDSLVPHLGSSQVQPSITIQSASGGQLTSEGSNVGIDDEDIHSYDEEGSIAGGDGKSRAHMHSDIYSMNALDELEAFCDSMDSLNSIGCEDDDITGEDEFEVKVKQPGKEKAKKPVASDAPLLIDDSDNSLSGSGLDDEELSLCSFGSTADLNAYNSTPLPNWIEIGVSVIVLSTKGDSPEKGYIRFIGETEFASGTWVGVQLDNMKGKNNGTVQNRSYFQCKPNHGVFVRHDRLLMDKKRAKKSFSAEMVATPPSKQPSNGSKASPSATSTPSYLKPTQSSKSRKT